MFAFGFALRQAISKVSEKAGKEYQIEQALEKMASEWENVNLFIDPYVHTMMMPLVAFE